jgi:hypothetical protein
MSPLKCHTVQEAIWERAASAGPASLSPALIDHLASCPACQDESRAVGEMITVTRALPDPEPPADVWRGFDEELDRHLSRVESPLAAAWRQWGRRAMGVAAVLVVGFALGLAAARLSGPSAAEQAAAQREAVLAALADDIRLEASLAQLEERLAEGKLPSGMVAGPAVPATGDAARLAEARAERERLRQLLIGVLAAEVEAEAHGFGYLDRRIAGIAGQHFLYIVP